MNKYFKYLSNFIFKYKIFKKNINTFCINFKYHSFGLKINYISIDLLSLRKGGNIFFLGLKNIKNIANIQI